MVNEIWNYTDFWEPSHIQNRRWEPGHLPLLELLEGGFVHLGWGRWVLIDEQRKPNLKLNYKPPMLLARAR